MRQQDGLVAQRGEGGLAQVAARVDAGEFGGFDEAVEESGDFGAALEREP